jgi:hypothetical protein
MSKQLEELSKDLASGVSRRKAFLRFGAGMGAVALGLFTGKKAKADDTGLCDGFCTESGNYFYGIQYSNHGGCVSACNHSIRMNKTH